MNNITPVFPVSSADFKLFPLLLDIVKQFGPYPTTSCVIAASHELKVDAEEWKESLAGTFRDVKIALIDCNGVTGYPLAPNRHFRKTMEWVAQQPDLVGGVWWLESDCVPLRRTWLFDAQNEYMRSGKAFWGTLVPTRGYSINANGELTPSYNGHHMVGAGVWPVDFVRRTNLLQTVDQMRYDLGNRALPPIVPFDIHFHMEVLRDCCETTTIQHNWSTMNYRLEGGRVVCDITPDKPDYTERARPLRRGINVLHGCKDGSLHKLVLEGVDLEGGTQPEAPKPTQHKTIELPPAPIRQPSFLGTRIHKVLDGKAQKMPALVRMLGNGVTSEDVEAAIRDPANDLEIVRFGWIQRKSTATATPAPAPPAEELAHA